MERPVFTFVEFNPGYIKSVGTCSNKKVKMKFMHVKYTYNPYFLCHVREIFLIFLTHLLIDKTTYLLADNDSLNQLVEKLSPKKCVSRCIIVNSNKHK